MVSVEDCLLQSLAESKEQRGTSISAQSYHPSLTAGIKLSQSVCIFLSTQSGMTAIPTVKAQRHKDLMEYIDLAHAARGFGGVVGFSTQLKLLSSLLGQMAVIIHFERDISHLAQAGTTFTFGEG